MTTYINVPVPQDLVPEVMALIARRMAEPEEAKATPGGWTPKSLRKLWTDSGPAIREFLTALAAVPSTWVPTSVLMPKLTRNTTEKFAGMLGALGRRCKHRHGGMLPFEREWDPEHREYRYLMAGQIAEEIRSFSFTL